MSDPVHPDVMRPAAVGALRRVNQEPAPWLYRRLAPVLHHLVTPLCLRDWDDFAALPAQGPAILVANHLTSLDALLVGEYILYHGRFAYFLGKSTLWNIPVLSWLLRSSEQIPVYRGTLKAGDSLVEARRRLDDGKVVFLFPEGTTARDPLLWPFAAKTGAARLAMQTGVPVIPFGHWGASTICPDNAGQQRSPHLFPRHWVCFRSGQPLDLTAYGHDTDDRDAVRAATCAILDGIVTQVERARGETAPELRWNPRTGDYVPRDEAVW